MRDVAVTEGDKVEAQLRFGVSVNTYGVNDLVAVVDAGRATRDVDALVAEYEDSYDVVPELRAGRRPARVAALRAPGSSWACAHFLEAGGFGAFTTNFEDLGGLRQLPGHRGAAADGRRLRIRRRGRLEDLGAAAHRQGDGPGRPAATSFMEDYTYHLAPGEEKILGAHMLEVCPTHRGRASRGARSTRSGIGGREDPVRLVFDADPGPGRRRRPRRHGRPVPAAWPTRSTSCAPDEPLPNLPVARAVWKPRPSFATSAEAWLTAGGPHHTVLTTAVGIEELTDFAEMLAHRTAGDRRARPGCATSARRSAGTRPISGWLRDSETAFSALHQGARARRSDLRQVVFTGAAGR